MSPLLIDLPQMVDLALGTPDSGVVNFNVLQALLHIIVRRLPLQDCRVEFRGEHRQKIESLIPHIQKEQMLSVIEYDITDGDTTNRTEKDVQKPSEQISTIIEIRKPTDGNNEDNIFPPGFPLQPIDVTNSIHDPIAPTLPENHDILQTITSSSNSNPFTDMWNMLNVTKRLDALEIALQKLSSMVYDVGKDYNKLNQILEKSRKQDDIFQLKDQLDELDRKIDENSKSLLSVTVTDENDAQSGVQLNEQNLSPPKIKQETTVTADAIKTTIVQETIVTPRPIRPKLKKDCEICSDIEYLKNDMKNLKIGLQKIAQLVNATEITHELQKDIIKMPCPGNAPALATFDNDDKRILQVLQRKTEKFERTFTACSTRENELETKLTEMSEKLEIIYAKENSNENNASGQTLPNLYEIVEKLASQINHLILHCDKLEQETKLQIDEITNLQTSLSKLEEITKADKAEIDEMMQEKADVTILHRKVSLDHFDAANRQILTSLNEINEKIDKFDSEFRATFQDFHTVIETKTNDEHFKSFQDHCDEKLKKLQERIKTLAMLNREPEAAGTRMKYLRDVACISCQTDCIMRTEEKCVMPNKGEFAPNKSIRPILTYELDNLRKEWHNLPHSRNMNHFEIMTKGMKARNDTNKKLKRSCARYCGGSHTAVRPEEMYRRCNLPKLKVNSLKYGAEKYVKGSDGTMYKGLNLKCICQPSIIENSTPAENQVNGEKPLEKIDE